MRTLSDRPLRFVTAASLFDGHDAAITIMRRILQTQGAEVIHLGHDRSVTEVVRAAIHEDADGIAVSSYQGGHVEYFTYLRDSLRESGADHIGIYGGGGGVILPEEIALLAARDVRIYSPEEGQRLGLVGMIEDMLATCRMRPRPAGTAIESVLTGDEVALGRTLTAIADGTLSAEDLQALAGARQRAGVPVLGITGTGGSGKSSLTDEIVRRLRKDSSGKVRVAVLAVDPTRSRGGGALLGDRIRMNSTTDEGVFFRSIATRGAASIPDHLPLAADACAAAGYDLVIVETPGIGQGDRSITEISDLALYVMTPEFGASTQLEKIDMLDYADVVAINKFDRRGALDAHRDVSRQLLRNRGDFTAQWQDMPVFGTSAARFDDDGVTALAHHLERELIARGLQMEAPEGPATRITTAGAGPVPIERARYLSEIAEAVHAYHRVTTEQALIADEVAALETAYSITSLPELTAAAVERRARLLADVALSLQQWPDRATSVRADPTSWRTTLSGTRICRVGMPSSRGAGDLVRYLRSENLPGSFPFTAGVFPLKRDGEMPARMFAGEGDPDRTNRRFHLLAEGQPATRLSVAFDSVTLYGRDPAERPDIYGKVGTSGVSVATIEDMRALFRGFDLCDPATSVSMTINGPAPTILAMFLTCAIDDQIERAEVGRAPLSESERAEVATRTLATIRGTVQADILKEDQGQNTCIFSTEFALRCMADMEQWFIDHRVRSFYSVSISGYHIAEAGAFPITQLAFTLANAFTYVEAYLARGMDVDDFAPHFSFFFSNGMDAEYTVLGRVARRIWAIAMRDRYGAGPRAQRLKYHIQTSGRSLHAQEMSFNDIRTTLQALCAYYDSCNSLHTNAYDEAVTTPTDESVRRALAIQLIIDSEWGLAGTDNPLQGSYVVEELTDLVEEAVLAEFDRLTERGGVLGAMETGYQRGRIQDESLEYERRKHDGSLPIFGVNTFLDPDARHVAPETVSRATEHERAAQVARLRDFQERHRGEAPAALRHLQQVARDGGNTFEALMQAVRSCSLGEITQAFFEVGGQYRRGM
ncbi:MAG: fused isobutyryl-CoA mutase/GTPase IcmF [Candidatus Nanopelagicales bacterium]